MKTTTFKTHLLTFLLAALAICSCSKNNDPNPPTPAEKTAQTWTGTEYTIKTPVEKGEITLSVSANVDGPAKLIIPAGLKAEDNPSITITLAEGASFTGSLTVDNADYTGTVILKVAGNGQIAIGTTTPSTNNSLIVNLPKGSFSFNGTVSGNVLVNGGNCKVGAGAIVKGTVTTHGATGLVVEGTIQGTIAGGNVTINGGGITKDIVITEGGKIKVSAGAKVEGSVDASKAKEIEVADGTVSGEIILPINPDKPTPVTGVTLDKTTATIALGRQGTLIATIAPAIATNRAVSWTSSDATVVSVDDKGVVKGLKEGTATITVTTADGGKTATCTITVIALVNPDGNTSDAWDEEAGGSLNTH